MGTTESKRRSLVKGWIKGRVGVLSVAVLENGREWPSVTREEPLRVRSVLTEDVLTCLPCLTGDNGPWSRTEEFLCKSACTTVSVHAFSAVGKGQLC